MLANIGEILRSTRGSSTRVQSCVLEESELGKQCPRPRGGGGRGEYLTNSVHARLGRIFDINDIM